MSHEILVCQSPHPDGATHLKPPTSILVAAGLAPQPKSTAAPLPKGKCAGAISRQGFPAAGGTSEQAPWSSCFSKDGIT